MLSELLESGLKFVPKSECCIEDLLRDLEMEAVLAVSQYFFLLMAVFLLYLQVHHSAVQCYKLILSVHQILQLCQIW